SAGDLDRKGGVDPEVDVHGDQDPGRYEERKGRFPYRRSTTWLWPVLEVGRLDNAPDVHERHQRSDQHEGHDQPPSLLEGTQDQVPLADEPYCQRYPYKAQP